MLFAALATAPDAWAQPSPPLSFADALTLAAQQAPALAAARAQAGSAREMAAAAGQRPDPVLRADVNNLPTDGADRFSLTRDFMTMRSLSVMQELTRPDKLRARAGRAAAEAGVADANFALASTTLRRETAAAWLERHYQERLRELARSQRDEALLQVTAAEAAYRGARGPLADIYAARAAVAQTDDRLHELDTQIATATTRLARWIGAAAERPLAAPPDVTRPPLDEAALTASIERQPQVALAGSQEALAQADAEVARANRHTDWTVELMYSQRGPAYSNMLSLNVTIPLAIDRAQRQDRELAGRLAQVEQMRAQRDDAQRAALAEARTALQQWRSRLDRAAHHETLLVPLAAERTGAALAAYRGGSGTLTGVLEARRAELEVRTDRLRLEMEAALLWAQLVTLLPESAKERP